MSRLPDLERSLVEAAARLNAAEAQAPEAAEATGLRARWQRMSRRGHIAGLLAGTLVLGAVTTGSAQVAGLDPFQYLRGFERDNAQLAPRTGPGAQVTVSAPPGAQRNWLARAYVTRHGSVCMNGGRERPNRVRAGGGLECRDTEEIAQGILDAELPGRVITGHAVVKGRQERPERIVVFGLVADGAPGFAVSSGDSDAAIAGAAVAQPSSEVLRVAINKSTRGLSAAGQQLLATFPDELRLRLFAAEIAVPARARKTGDLMVHEEPGGSDDGPSLVLAMDSPRWERRHRPEATSRERLLERVPEPVDGATALQRRLIPALGRPRTGRDALPKRLMTDQLTRLRMQSLAARRLETTNASDAGPVWVLPGAMPDSPFAMAEGQDGMVCLVGDPALATCFGIWKARPVLRALEVVICAPGLEPSQTLVWALVPAGASRAKVSSADGSSVTLPVRDLLVLSRTRSASRVTGVTWLGDGFAKRERTRYPRETGRARCAEPDGPKGSYVDLRESTTSSGLQMWTPRSP